MSKSGVDMKHTLLDSPITKLGSMRLLAMAAASFVVLAPASSAQTYGSTSEFSGGAPTTSPPSATNDYGDAPASYGNPVHGVGDVYLGANWDSESSAAHSTNADGDDNAGTPDDEDGITGNPFSIGANSYDFVTPNGGRLSLWIDLNQDGDFLDSGEQLLSDVEDDGTGADTTGGDGVTNVAFTIPTSYSAGDYYTRVRISKQPGLDPVFGSESGEVEDYYLTIGSTTPTLPTFTCSSGGFYLSVGAPSTFYELDLGTGTFNNIAALGERVNGIGYNPQDDYIYGNDRDDPGHIYRIGSNGIMQSLGYATGMTAHSNSADFNASTGRYLMTMSGNPNTIYEMDVTTTPPSIVATHAYTGPDATGGDIAFNPADGRLYSVDFTGGNNIIIIDYLGGTSTSLPYSGISPTSALGSQFFDSAGNLYAYQNNNGNLYQFDTGTGAATLVVSGPAASGGSDGARCANAGPPITIGGAGLDYGDAPASYVEASVSINNSAASGGNGVYTGLVPPDTDTGSWSEGTDNNGSATDDDVQCTSGGSLCTDDEDALATPYEITQNASGNLEITISAYNDIAPANSHLRAWLDMDANGTFDADEMRGLFVVNAGGKGESFTISWTTPADVQWGSTYLRIVHNNTKVVKVTGDPSVEGEVEDHEVILRQAADLDYGDAPASYGAASVEIHNVDTSLNGIYMGVSPPDVDADNWGGDGTDNSGNSSDDDAVVPCSPGSCTVFDDEDATALTTGLTSNAGATHEITLPVTNDTASPVYVQGWVDFDGNGTFDTDEAAIERTVAASAGSTNVTLNWLQVSNIGPLNARFIISDTPSIPVTGHGVGEVEDHRVNVVIPDEAPFDFGDAPASYGAASQRLANMDPDSSPLILGTNGPDKDEFNWRDFTDNSLNATDDDTNDGTFPPGHSRDDEDLAFGAVPTGGPVITLAIPVTNTTGFDTYLQGWIDFNNNGTFDGGESSNAEPTISSSGTYNLNWSVISEPSPGNYFARIILSDESGITANDNTGIGEVEDLSLTLGSVDLDYGDAPASYGAASQQIHDDGSGGNSLYIGAISPDVDPQNWYDGTDDSGTANDDDSQCTAGLCLNDEDAVSTAGHKIVAQGYRIGLTYTKPTGAPAYLQGWVDFDGNGTFDADEMATEKILPSGTGASSSILEWTPPVDTVYNSNTFVRVIISDTAGIDVDGNGVGEVEDHPINISDNLDYGDAPASYGPASISIDLGEAGNRLYIGAVEPDVNASNWDDGTDDFTNATDDDQVVPCPKGGTCADDDEEVLATGANLVTSSGSLSLNVPTVNDMSADVFLRGWVDFDGNGTFDADEMAALAPAGGSGATVQNLNWTVPADTLSGTNTTYLRLIVSETAPTTSGPGMTARGEVEDHEIALTHATGPGGGTATLIDTDTDGVPDVQDWDDDNDGIRDIIEHNGMVGLAGTTSNPWPNDPSISVTYTSDTNDTRSGTVGDQYTATLLNARSQSHGACGANIMGSTTYTFSAPVPANQIALWFDYINVTGARYTITSVTGSANHTDFSLIENTHISYTSNVAVLNHDVTGGFVEVVSAPVGVDSEFILAGGTTRTVSEITVQFEMTDPGSPCSVDKVGLLSVPQSDAAGTGKDSDNDGWIDALDIDADDDGIPDNIEAQATASYIPPASSYDSRGIDTAYIGAATVNVGSYSAIDTLDPVNTDTTDNPDYLDLDSDNDSVIDAIEGWDTNGDGTPETGPIAARADNDRDGLDDIYDAVNGFNQPDNARGANIASPASSVTPSSFPDVASNPGGDRDWRDNTSVPTGPCAAGHITVCSKTGSWGDINHSRMAGVRAITSNSALFGSGGVMAPETFSYVSIPTITSAALASNSCDLWISGYDNNFSAAEQTALNTWLYASSERYLLGGCDAPSNDGACETVSRGVTGYTNTPVDIINTEPLHSINPLQCTGSGNVLTAGGASGYFASYGSDVVLATYDDANAYAEVITDALDGTGYYLLTGDIDMWTTNSGVNTDGNLTSDNDYFVANTFKFAADMICDRDYAASNCNGLSLDYGDAPGYAIAAMELSSEVVIGPNGYAPDSDSGNWHNGTDDAGNATDDDTNDGTFAEGGVSDDEDGDINFPFTLDASGAIVSLDIPVANNLGADTYLQGWIDFDGSGSFDADEMATEITVADTGSIQTITLNWAVPGDAVSGASYVRLIMSDTASIDVDGNGQGEVEDHYIQISTSPAFTCTSDFYISTDSPAQLYSLDIPTSSTTPIGPNSPLVYNGIGYNPVDNYIYASNKAGANPGHLYRIGSDGSVFDLGATIGWTLASNLGDVTAAGVMLVRGGTNEVIEIDLSTTPPQFIASHTVSGVSLGGDFAINPVDGKLYGASGGALQIVDMTSWTGSTLATSPAVPNFGAMFFDNAGMLYGYENNTGDLHQIDVTTGANQVVANGPHVTGSDGTRCPNAPPPAFGDEDYGDAPGYVASSQLFDGSSAFLGSVAPDVDTGNWYNGTDDAGNATDDDTNDGTVTKGSASDEDLVMPFTFDVSGAIADIDVTVDNPTGGTVYLQGWVDFDGSGTFDADEIATEVAVTAAGSSTQTLSWAVPGDAADISTYSRFIVSNTSGIILTGNGKGEVEDHHIQTSTQAAGTCVNEFFFSMNVSGGNTQLYDVDIANAGLNPIGSASANYNGIGFNIMDGYLYGMASGNSGDVVRIGLDGSVVNLGNIGPTTNTPFAGDVAADGTYYIRLDTTIIGEIDLSTTPPTLVATHNVAGANIGGDLSINPVDGKLYTISGNLYAIDPTTWTATSIPSSVPNMGASFFDSTGTMYGWRNGSPGTMYEIDVTTGIGFPVLYGPDTGASDGARCMNAPPPIFPRADIELQKLVDNPNPLPGSNVTFTLVATNTGAMQGVNIEITDQLPAGLTWVSDDSAGAYDVGTGVWTVGDIPAGGIETLNITVTVTGTAPIINRAQVTAMDNPDLDSDPNAGFGSDDLGDGIQDDDEAETTVIPTPAEADETFLWRPDHSSTVSHGVFVTYKHILDIGTDLGGFPLDFTITSTENLSWTIYADTDGSGDYSPGDLPWNDGDPIGAGANQVFFARAFIASSFPVDAVDYTEIMARVITGSNIYTHSVTDTTRVSDDTGILATKMMAVDTDCDGSLGDENAYNADFSVFKEADPGACVVFRIAFTNASTAPVTEVKVHDMVPANLTYEGASASVVSQPPSLSAPAITQPPANGTGPLKWEFGGTLVPGDGGTVEFRARLGS